MQQMHVLWSFDEFSNKAQEIWEEPDFFSWKWDIALANAVDLQEHIFWESDKHLTHNLHSYSEEELFKMKEESFDITDNEKMKNFIILLGLELWNWIEDILKFIGNIPAAVILLPRYITNRVTLSDSSIDSIDEVEAQMENDMLLKENPALMLCELLWEKWIQMIKKLWEMFVSWKNGDIASVLVMIAWLLAWWAWLAKIWSNLARKSAVKSARSAWRKNRTTQWREFRNNLKTLSGTADNVMNKFSKIDDIIWGAGLGHITWAYSHNVGEVRHIENSNIDQNSQNLHSYIDHIETKVDISLLGEKKVFDLEDNTKMKLDLWWGWEIIIHKTEWQYYIYSEWPSWKEKELAHHLHAQGINIMHLNNAHKLKEWDFFDLWRGVKNFNIWWSSVSKNHLSIKLINGKIEIHDHSTNGTNILWYQERIKNFSLKNQSESYTIKQDETMNINVLQQYTLKVYKDAHDNLFFIRNNEHIKLDNNSSYAIWKDGTIKYWGSQIYWNDQILVQIRWNEIVIKDNSDYGTNVSINKDIWRNISNRDYQQAEYERYLDQKKSSLQLWNEVYVTRSNWALEKWWIIDEINNWEYILIREYIDWNWNPQYLERQSTLDELYTINEIENPKAWDASWDEVSEMKKRSFEHIKHNSQLSEHAFNTLFKWDLLKQQNVWNCYLISALNSLRKSPHYETIIRLSVRKVHNGYSVKVPLWDKNWQEIFVSLQDIQAQKNVNFWKADNFWKIDRREYLYPIDGPEGLKILEAAYWKLITQKNSKEGELFNRLYMEGWYWDNALIDLLWSNSLDITTIRGDGIFQFKWHLKTLSEKWDKIIQKVENFLDNFHPWKDIATVNTPRSQWWHDSSFNIDGKIFYHSHAYSITNVDKFNQIVHVTNPWNAHEIISITYDQFMRIFCDTSSVEVKPDRFLK
jgi:hypothetical protein